MCGPYYSLFDKQQVAEHFHVRHTADNVGINRSERGKYRRRISDLFGTLMQTARTMKAPKPIKRVFAITLPGPGPFAFAGI